MNYRMSINDEDGKWIKNNPLSKGDEIGLIRDFNLLDRREREKLLSVKKMIEKIDRSCRMGDEELIQLAGKDKCCVMMCYLSLIHI